MDSRLTRAPGGIDRGAAPGGSPRRGRVRAVVVQLRRAGVTPRPRAPGGGGPRAARARAGAARPRARSAPCARPAPRAARRARSLHQPEPQPRLRPVFLWARQLDGRVQAVHCEDYDHRNRIRIARTPDGWRVIPRTEIYNSIRVPPARRRSRNRKRRARSPAWPVPDLESHIPSHTIAVPRPPEPPAPGPAPPAPEPTPLDSLLAVAELEFHQQRGKELELEPSAEPYAFLPDEAVARDVMSFELGEPPKTTDDLFFERKTHQTEEDFQNNLVVHKDLFETISEAHYLPELSGPHDEALLESLVEKGCEDNQILGQALDKLAHLVTGGDYAEEEEDMLLSGAPVADIIDRLEQSLESPGRSSITAAQGLLHLHHVGDQQRPTPPYMPDDQVFAPEVPPECTLTLATEAELQDANEIAQMDYEQEPEKLDNTTEAEEPMFEPINAERVLEAQETYEEKTVDEQPNPTLPKDSETVPSEVANNIETQENCEQNDEIAEDIAEAVLKEEVDQSEVSNEEFVKEAEDPSVCELVATDLSLKAVQKKVNRVVVETNNVVESVPEKIEDLPRDLSVHRRLGTPLASPRRGELPRAPSRESDAMQSPQPSGIPAVPSSPEIFTMAPTKSKQTLFLETLLSSPSPKMYTSEVTITKQQCEPLNLGKNRKSASPTVSSCSDEIRKLNKEFGEPQEKKIRKESTEDLARISKVFNNKPSEEPKKQDKGAVKLSNEISPIKQLQNLKTCMDFNIPDPLLVPKDKLNNILAAPGREIRALLAQRPELRLPEAFAYPSILQDPDILVISLSQLETILENNAKKNASQSKEIMPEPIRISSSEPIKPGTPLPDQTAPPKPSQLDALATDIDAATSAALNQMFWLPYLSQLEVMAACSQNSEFLKAFNASGYSAQNYAELSQMLNTSRFMGPGGFPMMPQMDYDNRLQFAMWQEAMNQANAAAARQKPDTQKDIPSKSSDVQNPFVHSTKNHPSKSHSAARTSPIAHNYNTTSQRSMAHNPFFQGMYPGMNPNIRPNMPLPGLQIPYFNPNMMGSQRSPRTGQQKSPTSPYYPNNNYLQSVKQSEASQPRSSSVGSQESPRPRISVKSLQNLLEPSAAASRIGSRRASNPVAALGRRRDEPEVGSTTPGEPPPLQLPHPMPHPHDPAAYHLWHPLFGNQKGYNSPWSWTTVTATGD